MTERSPRLTAVVSQRFLPAYRIEFFDHLNELLEKQGVRLLVLYNWAPGVSRTFRWALRLPAVGFHFSMNGIQDSAILCLSIVGQLARIRPSIAVLEDLGGLPSSLQAAWWCRHNHVPFLIWGLGRIPSRNPSPLRRMLGPAIEFLYSSSSGFICYSSYAAHIYERYHRKTYIALNAASAPPEPREVETLRAAFSAPRRHNGFGIVSIGRLLPQKRLNVLIDAAARIGDTPCEIHIIGDGPERDALVRRALDLKIANRVHFHGEIYDFMRKAEVFAACDVGVLPGRGGLAIQELMRHGLPVISGSADGTEQDIIEDACNGFKRDGVLTVPDLTELLARAIATPRERWLEMRNAALDTVVKKANISAMAHGFADALTDTLRRSAMGPAALIHSSAS